MAKAGFTLSLDCEGLWGMADQNSIVHQGLITQKSLANTYNFIRHTLNSYQIKATAAFVTCFAVKTEILQEQLFTFQELAAICPTWFANILTTLENKNFDGWCGANFYQDLFHDGHEMAWHGCTHLSLSDKTPDAAIELELYLAKQLFTEIRVKPKTVIFPRNMVGHLDYLKNAGFETYRCGHADNAWTKLTNVINEFHIFDDRTDCKPHFFDGWNLSPSGFFLNWPSGPRIFIPNLVTILRWKSLLRSAVNSGGYIHMWFHPHNLITAPAMRDTFVEIMKEVRELHRIGDLEILTIDEANKYYGKHKNAEIS